MKVSKFLERLGAGCGLLLAGLLLAGCQSGAADRSFAEVPGVTAPAAASSAAPSGQNTAAVAAVAAGATEDLSKYILQPQDALYITFADLPQPWAPFDDRIKEDGSITLPLNQKFQAAGKTTIQLMEEIRAKYVPSYFVNMTVMVKYREESRFYFVDGEVKSPSRQPWLGRTTVSKAIASVGGFTDYAKKGRVQLTRADGSKATINCRKAITHPELDLAVYPNDKIYVPRRILW